MSVSPFDFIVIEADLSIKKPGKRMLATRYRDGQPKINITIWRRWLPQKNGPSSEWKEFFENGNNLTERKILSIVDGELKEIDSETQWWKNGGIYSSRLDDEAMANFLKKYGLKGTVFHSIEETNDFCISKGFPRIGGFVNARSDENYFAPTTTDIERKVFEKRSYPDCKLLGVSLTPFPRDELDDLPLL